MTAPLHAWSAAELAAAYAAGSVSPVEVVEGSFARMAALEPRLAATWAPDPEAMAAAARAAARASEARWRRGEPLSPLDGVPLTLKENIATRGHPVPLGTAASLLAPAAADAPPAARLAEAGAVLVAKTTMPDYGMLSSGLSSFHRLTRNPWNTALNPGGSSAGAGVAAAVGYAPLNLGTDIGGSIRLPAGWCGIVGFKPSAGRVPIDPPYLGRVAGPMTRSVADAAALMAVLSRPDDRDATRLPYAELPWHEAAAATPERLRGLRVGLWLDAGWGLSVDAGVAAAVRAAARRFEDAGAHVEPLAPFAAPALAAGIERFWQLRSFVEIERLPPERRARVLPFIRAWVEPAAGFDAAGAFADWSCWAALRDATVAATAGFDLVISPVTPVASFAAELAMPSADPRRAMSHVGFTLPFNASEQPAACVPTGAFAGGLPVGLQIAARRHDDLGALAAARAFEIVRGPLPPWPEPGAATT